MASRAVVRCSSAADNEMRRTRIKTKLKRRHLRVRSKVHGTADRPRLCIHKSHRHLYVQIADDRSGRTLTFATTNHKENRAKAKQFSNVENATKLGRELGKKAKEQGIEGVVFDRGGYRYHGVVRAFAEAARKGGLLF